MNSSQIEKNIVGLIDKLLKENYQKDEFIFDFLTCYNLPKATITLLRKGKHNLSKLDGCIILKKKIFFLEVKEQDLHLTINNLDQDIKTHKHNPRFIIVTNYKNILAIDTKTKDSLDCSLNDLPKNFDFFLPLAGIEKTAYKNENPADIKAASKMAKIYDEILKDNEFQSEEQLHQLNIFLSRLLFCFFAEDTGIFDKAIFTNSVSSHTNADGSDLNSYLNRLFQSLNKEDKSQYPNYLQKFPYVNGGLFAKNYDSPKFSKKSRDLIIECGQLDWSEINPDIFGSMIQAVVHPSMRGGLGMHYTSVPNIMKVIEPLFLNELQEEFEKAYNDEAKLNKLLGRITKIKIFDPACGSGNFLIIAYKELRKLEIEIWNRRCDLKSLFKSDAYSFINLENFYGIEIDDFAHEIAILSLYLAKHQMNVKFKENFGHTKPILPLKESGKIICANATRINWEEVCPKKEGDEIYILGNPPYLGFLQQNKDQKKDIDIVFGNLKTVRKLDYIACWFLKGSKYIRGSNAYLSFVSTNSICQGEQVALLWPYILKDNIEIYFANTSFKWTNNAKNNAGVACVVVGLSNRSTRKKYLFSQGKKNEVNTINAYLSASKEIYVIKHNKPISKLPKISLGSAAYDGGHLMLTKKERDDVILKFPRSEKFLRKFVGSAEFLNDIDRYCIWVEKKDLEEAYSITSLKERIDKVRKFRMTSDRKQTRETSDIPHSFTENRHIERPSIIIPIVSSERRELYACGFLDGNQIIPNSARAIYDSEPYVFGVISSKIHMLWIKAVSGQLETRIRYSAGICYNGFPFPDISEKQKQIIQKQVYNILSEREKHPEKTMAQLYDPDKMPDGLRQAHHFNDLAIESCYRSKPFASDEERLEYLFKLYEKMTSGVQDD